MMGKGERPKRCERGGSEVKGIDDKNDGDTFGSRA
jgi:hypothetical protein